MTEREIYDTQIAPLMEQVDALCLKHKFSYIVAIQYSEFYVSRSALLKHSDKSMVEAWNILESAIEDER